MWLLPSRPRGTDLPERKPAPRVPLPTTLPGAFFVLGYDRDRDTFVLVVDDDDESSYNLGRDIPPIMQQFERWGLADIGPRAIDAAREFRLVQVIPREDRIIRLTGHEDPVTHIARQLAAHEEQESAHVRHLP